MLDYRLFLRGMRGLPDQDLALRRMNASPRYRDPLQTLGKRPTFSRVMADLASRIVGHYEQHAVAWDADRQNSYWNDKIWHDRFIARLGKDAKVLWLGATGRAAHGRTGIARDRRRFLADHDFILP